MKRYHRWNYTIALAAIGTIAFTIPAFAGDWRAQEGRWYYEESGRYLNDGWHEIDGKWYYFKSTGEMAADETIDGYRVGTDGVWVEDGAQAQERVPYPITLEQVIGKHLDSYTAGRGSVYGKALNQQELNAVAVKVHEIVTTAITADMDDLQKVEQLYTYLVKNCSYAPTWQANRANTAWGALVYGEAQCSGYARAFKALCDAVDIPCYYVHANSASINPSHQWDIVQVGGKWYHIDAQGGLFLVSDQVYASTGMEWDRAAYPVCPESLGSTGRVPVSIPYYYYGLFF